ncbi:MAG: PAS domain-containing protein [Nitrosospira sp.]
MNQPEIPIVPDWLRGSEMGEFIYAHDWTESGLGPIQTWAPSLQLAINTVLLLPSAALLLWGPEFIQIYNDCYRDLMGAKHPDGLGQPAHECWPEVWSFFAPICASVFQRRESFIFDDKRLMINRNGSLEETFFKLTFSPVPGGISDHGEIGSSMPGGVLVTAYETTELIRARAREAERIRLKETTQAKRIRLLEEVFRNAPSFLHVLRGPEFVFELANDAYYQLVGHRELIGRPAFEALPEAAEDGYQQRLSQVMATGEPFMGFELPVTLIRTPGAPSEERLIDLIYLPLFEEDGTCRHVLGHGVDVTTHVQMRKKTEEALRASEARFRAMAEASPALTWQVDASGNAVYLNQRFMDLIGLTLEELMSAGWRSIIHPDDAPAYVAAFEQALRDRSRFQQRVRVKTAAGEWCWLKSYALPWFTADGEYAGHAGISIDITGAVNAETALLEADRRKNEFLATLAHELRNPLAPISNALALIARPDGATAIPRVLPVIKRQVEYMARLVDDLLEISRITSGKIELRQEPADLAVVLRNAVDASMSLIDEKGHKLSVSIPEAPLIVYADAVRLEQVFSNLLNNAARYTKRGGNIWLTARQEGKSVVVSVRDNGIGILPGMLPRLFNMFSQERRNGIGTQEGLGIGLNLVARLLQMHGGSVEALSKGSDEGSEFIVRLPLSEIPARGSTCEPERVVFSPSGLRILVVDDNHDAAEVLCMLLESMGFNAKAVNSGPAALGTLPAYQPNVILLDIGMPGMNGYEVARRIREQPQFDGVKLVALTGWGQEEDRRLSKNAGFDHHLTKPVDCKVLKDLITAI